MKACKCDVCGNYMDRTAVGVLYDNRILERKRFDLCPRCLVKVLVFLDGLGLDESDSTSIKREY